MYHWSVVQLQETSFLLLKKYLSCVLVKEKRGNYSFLCICLSQMRLSPCWEQEPLEKC